MGDSPDLIAGGSNDRLSRQFCAMVARSRICRRVLRNVNALPADLRSMMRRLIWLFVLSFSFAFIVTAAAGPVVSVVACAGVLVYALALTRGDAACRDEAAEAEAEVAEAETEDRAAAAEAAIAEAEAVVTAARLRLLGGAAS